MQEQLVPTVYRFTGPPENWITGIGLKKWAVNENNKSLWERLKPGDIALLHSSASSAYSNKTQSAIIGYAVIGEKRVKNTSWWIQEIEAEDNKWPYVFSLDQLHLFSENLDIDFGAPLASKSREQIKTEVEELSQSGVSLAELQRKAKAVNEDYPNFPKNGSASRVHKAYEKLLLTQAQSAA
jgi:hypothetical protein